MNGAEKWKALLAEVGAQTTDPPKEFFLATHSETRFASQHSVLRSVLKSKDAIHRLFAHAEFGRAVASKYNKYAKIRALKDSLCDESERSFWDFYIQ